MFHAAAVICQLSIESGKMKLFDVDYDDTQSHLILIHTPSFFSASILNTSIAIKY